MFLITDIQLAIAHLVESNPENASMLPLYLLCLALVTFLYPETRSEWKLEAVNGRLKVVPEGEKKIDLDSEEFDESFVILPHEERPPSVSIEPPLSPRSEPIRSSLPAPSPQPTNPTQPQRPKSLPATPERLGLVHFDPSCTNHVYEVNAAFLALREGCTHIPPDSTYIVLPESNQFIMFVSTGHIKFTNRGDRDMLLRSHKRGCAKSHHVVGNTFTLGPRTSQAFDFKGAWFVEVVGKCDDLIVSDLALSGGGKGNKLGMA
jgi:hypothetical protein